MKRILLLLAFAALSLPAFSQVYKLETVHSSKLDGTYLSYWKVLEPGTDTVRQSLFAAENLFSLWGYKQYGEPATTFYEVEYYKAGAKDMFRFLTDIVGFARKYSGEKNVQADISGVKVKTFDFSALSYIQAFEPEGKVCCLFTEKQWSRFLEKFIAYCTENGIAYQ